MIVNPDKCRYMCIGENSNDNDILSLNKFNLKSSDEEIIPGITVDWRLTLDTLSILNIYVKKLVKNREHLMKMKKKLIYCSMIKSQLNYRCQA